MLPLFRLDILNLYLGTLYINTIQDKWLLSGLACQYPVYFEKMLFLCYIANYGFLRADLLIKGIKHESSGIDSTE